MRIDINNKRIRKGSLLTGFTLIEALVAISLLMIAISSPMMLAQKSLSSSILSRDQMIAAFLAQDGIEAIKNIRDYTAINQEATTTLTINTEKKWLYDLDGCICNKGGQDSCDFDNGGTIYCNVDSTVDLSNTNSILSSEDTISTISTMYALNNGEDFKNYAPMGTTPTKFSRKINIKENLYDREDEGYGHEAELKVRVYWDSPYGIQKIEIKTFIYNFESRLFNNLVEGE